jgi:hypothetical protein
MVCYAARNRLIEEVPVKPLIVSRHPATVAFVKALYGPDCEVKAEVNAADVSGRIVVGNLPMHLAALCKEMHAVEFAETPPRGVDLDAEAMARYGARIVAYKVIRV